MLFKTLSKPQVAWTNVTSDIILSTIIFQVVMARKYVCRHRVEWRFLQFFCLNQLVILMGKDNVSLVYEILSSICRLTKSNFQEPLNIGNDEMVSMNEMAENTFLVMKVCVAATLIIHLSKRSLDGLQLCP